MRYDLFYGRKSVHIKLTKEEHTALRQKLFVNCLSMQDVFQDFVETLLEDSTKADNIIKKIAKKKFDSAMKKIKRGKQAFGELDTETMYDLLEMQREESSNDKEEE